MSDSKLAILAMLSRLKSSHMLFYLIFLTDSKVPDYVTILSPTHFFVSLVIATVGRQIPSSTCFLIETLNLEKNLWMSAQNLLKLLTSLSYKKPTNSQVSWWCLVKKLP